MNDRQTVEEAVRAHLERRARGEEATGQLDLRGLEIVHVAAEPKQFPKAIQGLDAAGKVVAEFAFDPNDHP